MNILRIIASTDPEQGGPLEGLVQSASVMAQWGCRTEVVSLDDPAAPFVGRFPFPLHPQGPGLGRYGYTGRLARWLAANAPRFDVALMHGIWNHASAGAHRALRRAGLPYAVFAHGMIDPRLDARRPLKRPLRRLYWLLAEGPVLRDAGAVLFTAEAERRRALTAFPLHRFSSRTVAYGAPEPPPGTARQSVAFAETVPLLGRQRYLLFLGRIDAKKGIDLLITAFASFVLSEPDLDLVIAGPDRDDLAVDLRRLAGRFGLARRVHWAGMLRGAAKWGALRGAEALVLPSHRENFGIVVAEALACGTPVLISNKVDIWPIVTEAEAGFVAPDSVGGVRGQIARFLGLPAERRRRMRHAARRCYEDNFRIEAAARDLAAALEAVRRRR